MRTMSPAPTERLPELDWVKGFAILCGCEPVPFRSTKPANLRSRWADRKSVV